MSSLAGLDGTGAGLGWDGLAGRTDVALCRPSSIVCKFLVQSTKYPQPVKYLVCVFLFLRVRAGCSGFKFFVAALFVLPLLRDLPFLFYCVFPCVRFFSPNSLRQFFF
uniref:(northern house mosquito) hypothetical protein n=1 Tax=Culex pipiens TaxID=7175 RepID=A0A8D8BSI2_CULPI